MNKAIVIIGVGEMGGVFARGFLRAGYPVFPITRDMDLNETREKIADVESVIIAVREKDLPNTLEKIPESWKDKLVLLQNELLPKDWQAHNINPTVISVWFEKKKPNDYKVIIPSPIYGPQADLVFEALAALDIPCKVLGDEEELLVELVIKNLYILTVNIAGLEVGGTVGQLWSEHKELGQEVANNVLDIQFKLIGKELDRQKLIDGMVAAFEGDLDHKCMGRSAPVRLERAIATADQFGLDVKKLKDIQTVQSSP